jgi:uncharacterized Zn finger protein
MIELCRSAADRSRLEVLLRQYLTTLPLPFPLAKASPADVKRSILYADRHRAERLLGEILAARGYHEYAVVVARDYHARTGDALDLVRALARAGKDSEAIRVAKEALKNQQGYHRSKLCDELDRLLLKQGEERFARKAIEDSFTAKPSRELFAAVKARLSPALWEKKREALLGHLQRHRKSPTLVFELYLDEGLIVDADGLAVTQPVDATVLARGASRIEAEHPDRAAGWLLIAAHREVGSGSKQGYVRAREHLLRVKSLSKATGQAEAFEREVGRFRERYLKRRALIALLKDL